MNLVFEGPQLRAFGVQACIPATHKLKQEGCKFKAQLSYRVSSRAAAWAS